MTSDDVRKKYLAFFKIRGHSAIPSVSLVPENDPTTLFVGSGMQPLLPYLLGQKHPAGDRLVDSQKCFRAEDIEEVGDNRHTTFFEMLGNWSLGAYWKEEQLRWFFEFLTEEAGILKERLWVTCFEGDDSLGLPRDTESAAIWKDVGIPEERILFYSAEKNWWSRAGTPERMPAGEPGGPDSEVFYDFDPEGVMHETRFGAVCHPNCDCGRFMEIGNSVFMQYVKKPDGLFDDLPQRNVDFGGGLERITAAANDNPDIFRIDSLLSIITALEETSGKQYDSDANRSAFRVIADHMRAAVFMISDGVMPSNTEQGYFVRRLIRRSLVKMRTLGADDFDIGSIAKSVAACYKDAYPTLSEKTDAISETICSEAEKFKNTLGKGLKEFEKIGANGIPGRDAFVLFSTYGFPFELTKELAEEKKISVDEEAFKKEMRAHQELSRKGAEQKFKGGLADTSEMSVKYHTATHLLHQALRSVLGTHVFQKGSNITPLRLRFDFSHDIKMTDREKKQVEDLVNQKIAEALPVTYEDLSRDEAERRGALGLFEEKYGDMVRVYTIGDFSLEYCGGPHVESTKVLGEGGRRFVIKKEEAVSAGVRRIKAVLE